MSTNLSLFPPDHSSSNSSLPNLMDTCFKSEESLLVFSAFALTSLLLFSFFFYVLYLDYQQRREQRSASTSATSHSNVFMYHTITMQLFISFGFTCYFCGGYINLPGIINGGTCIWSVCTLGQALFNILTCVEHYLAVVYPIIYLGLRQAGGIRIRNIITGCVWLLSFGWLPVYFLSSYMLYLILYCSIMVMMLIAISFCSISVLCKLQRPGPGEVGGNRERVGQSKQRSFHTILVIMGLLFLKFSGNLIGILIVNLSMPVNASNNCLVLFSPFWIDLPSTLVLPLLFLHRIGKLQSYKQNTASG